MSLLVEIQLKHSLKLGYVVCAYETYYTSVSYCLIINYDIFTVSYECVLPIGTTYQIFTGYISNNGKNIKIKCRGS